MEGTTSEARWKLCLETKRELENDSLVVRSHRRFPLSTRRSPYSLRSSVPDSSPSERRKEQTNERREGRDTGHLWKAEGTGGNRGGSMSSGLVTLLTLRAAGPRGRVTRPEGRTAKRERQRGEAHGPEGYDSG